MCGFLPAAAEAAAAGASGVWPANTDGGIVGGQVGYNFQISNKLVAGIEADIQMMPGSDRASANTVTTGPFSNISTDLSVTKAIDYLGTLRGRLGYLVAPTVLVYGTGGFAYGGVRSSTTISQAYTPVVFNSIEPQWSSFASDSETITGWTAGAGTEWAVGSNISVKGEFLYYDLGTVTYNGGTLVDKCTAAAPFCSVYFANAVQTKFDNSGVHRPRGPELSLRRRSWYIGERRSQRPLRG